MPDPGSSRRSRTSPTAEQKRRRQPPVAGIEVAIGTMIETPRAALLADEIADEADFFSFGTNDLTQMTFGFSRDDVEGRMMAAYLEKGLLECEPVREHRHRRRRRAGPDRRRAGPRDQPRPQDRRLRRARRRPGLDRLLRQVGPRLRQLLAVPGADRPARSGAFAAGDRRGGRRRWRRLGTSARQVTPGQPTTDARRGTVQTMAIPDEDVAQVRSATDILAVIGEHTPLKRVGRRYVGLCPFHTEKSPSFSVNAEEGLYYCFGCQASGDAITFLRNIGGLRLRRGGREAGCPSRDHDPPRRRRPDSFDREGRQALLGVIERAVAFYHDELLSHPDASRARQYLRSRGYQGETVRQFSLGWAPEAGGSLVRAVRAPADLLVKAGLAHQTQRGLRDAFRGRVIFPIFDPMGSAIGLGGRLLPGAGEDAGPKYRNSPETPIYAKRRTLYGLNWAKQAAVQAGEVIVCEGYTDVIGFFTAGLPRAVATCGTSLTEEHFRLLGRFAKRVVLAFDADEAGQSAAARIYDWERRHELQVAVAALPPGSDPADLAMRDPEALREAVARARTFLAFRVERALASSELQTGEGPRPRGRGRSGDGGRAPQRAGPRSVPRDGVGPDPARGRAAPAAPRPARRGLRSVEAERAGGDGASRGRRERAAVAAGCRAAVGAGPRLRPGGLGAGRRAERAAAREVGGKPGRWHPARRAGLDALVLAIREPGAMAGRISECLFADPVQRAAYRALADATNLHEASRAPTRRPLTCCAASPCPSPTLTRTRPWRRSPGRPPRSPSGRWKLMLVRLRPKETGRGSRTLVRPLPG